MLARMCFYHGCSKHERWYLDNVLYLYTSEIISLLVFLTNTNTKSKVQFVNYIMYVLYWKYA